MKTMSANLATYILFADDTNIFVHVKSTNEAYENGDTVLRVLNKYMIPNKLYLFVCFVCYSYPELH